MDEYECARGSFKTKYWEYFNSIMEKYPPKNIIVNTYNVEKIKHP